MSDVNREALVAEAEKVNAERTALIAWVEDSLAAERAQEAKATDADTQYWAKWTAHHFERALSLLHADAAKVQELEHLLTVAAADLRYFTTGTLKLYTLGDEIRDAAIEHLPMGNGPWDRAVEKHIGNIRWQEEASKAIQAIRSVVGGDQMPDIAARVVELQADRDRLTAEVIQLHERVAVEATVADNYRARAEKAEASSERFEMDLGMERVARQKAEADVTRLTKQWEGAVDRVVQAVAELPDRTSPDDWPEAMLVTADELRGILVSELEAQR